MIVLDDFKKNVIYFISIVFITVLTAAAIILYKNKKEEDKKKLKGINCPDYWEDVSEGNCSNCINVKNLGTCGNNAMDFTTEQWVGDNGLCNKNEWAKKCDLTWDGITNNPNIKCVSGKNEFKPPQPNEFKLPTNPIAPKSEDKYFMFGPWIASNNEFKQVSRIENVGNNTIYMIQDGIHTKMVDNNGVAKYYDGNMSEFNGNKWNTYNDAQKNYILRQCPSTCSNGCDTSRVCSTSPNPSSSQGASKKFFKKEWNTLTGKLKQVDLDGSIACGVNSASQIWCSDTNTFDKPIWVNIPGGLTHVSISNGKLYGVNGSGQIWYASDYKKGDWKNIAGGLSQVSIDGNTVCGVNSGDEIFCKDDLTSGTWYNIPGKLKHISVSNGNLYGVNSGDEIFSQKY